MFLLFHVKGCLGLLRVERICGNGPMRLLSISQLIRIASGAILALLASLVVCPSMASAGCGDYVIRGQKSASEPMSMPEDKHSHSQPSNEHKFPCSGPNCSRGSDVPSAPAPTVSSPTDHWALAQSTLTPTEREPAEPVPSIGPVHSYRNELSVYHPPRASF